MIRKIGIIFVLIIVIFAVDYVKVEAGEHELKPEHYTLQCIYSDGSLITKSKNKATNAVYQNRLTYNLVGIAEEELSASGKTTFINDVDVSVNESNANARRCLYYTRKVVASLEGTSLSDLIERTTFYKFRDEGGYTITDAELLATDLLIKVDKSQYSDEDKARLKAIFLRYITSNVKANEYSLVSESYLLTSDAPEPIVSLFYVQKATQAAGNNDYVEVMVYENVVLLKKGDRVTRLLGAGNKFMNVTRDENMKIIGNPPDVIEINDPEAKIMNGEGGRISYYYNKGQTMYQMQNKIGNIGICKACNRRYELTDEILNLNGQNPNELCDTIMPETSKVLKKIIKFSQILVPVFLILLTSIDVGKIVLSGNLDEELPKQKTKIKRRLIITIVFFFLPLITGIFIDLVIESSEDNSASKTIKIIDCLFE